MNNPQSLESRVLEYLRQCCEDDIDDALKDTAEIAEYFDIPIRELYDFDRDSGALQVLQDAGLVRRIGSPDGGFSWMADGMRIVWT